GRVDDGHVTLWVDDEGPGLPPGAGASLFERFVRSRGEEPTESGMGLGLWIVKSIVDRHGGRVEAGDGGAGRRGRARRPRRAGAGSGAMKILVVDDDLDLRGLIAFALRQGGYLVLEASDGAAALAALEKERPDLAILDVNLPRLNGFEVLKRLRERGDRLPVI